MKNIICLSTFILAIVTQAFANNTPSYATLNVLKNEKAVILNLSEIAATSFVVYDAKGTSVFSQEIEKFEKGVKYMMTNLPTGQYTIKIQGNDFVELHKAVITAELLQLEGSETYFRPSIRVQDNKVMIDAILDTKEDIYLSIYDRNGTVVYDYTEQKSGTYNRVFDLTQLNQGDYVVSVSTDNFNTTQKISL